MDKRIHALVVLTQPAPGLVFGIWVYVNPSHTWGSLQHIEKTGSYFVSCPSAQESACLSDEVIAAEQQVSARAPNRPCFDVVTIAVH